MRENEQKNSFSRRILWVSPLILDVHLHKTTQLELLANLSMRGHKTSLMAVHSKKKVQTENMPVNVISVPFRYIPVFSPIMFAIVLFFFLPLYIIMKKPNYIFAEPTDVSVFGFLSTLPFLLTKRTQLNLDVRSTPVDTVGFRGYLQTLSFILSINFAKKWFNSITIITPHMKEEICARFKIDPKSVGVWSSGVSTILFNSMSHFAEGIGLKKSLGLSKNFVVFYHGSFTVNRGLIETIKAMREVKNENPDVILFLLGKGSAVSYLKDLVKAEGIEGNVIIHDAVEYEEVPKFISMSDVCIVPLPDHPFWRYQSPLKLLEYLSSEKTVILSDIPAHREVIGENKCGIYLSSTKPTEIAKSILCSYRHKDKLKEWGHSGRIIIDEKYSWKKVAEGLEKYLLSKS